MPSGNLVIDKNSDIFVDSPQVKLHSPSILISNDGKTIIFRVYFVDGKELMNFEKVTIIYGYTLLKGPMKTEENISQLRWHNSFSIPVSQISLRFLFGSDLFDSDSIKGNREFYRYKKSMAGTIFNVLEFNRTNITVGNIFVGSFNATNLKYSSCSYERQYDNVFFYSIIVPLLMGISLILLLSIVVVLFQRCCRKRLPVFDQETEHHREINSSRNSTNNSILVVPPKEQENKTQQSGLYYVTNTFNNVENNDGFTGVVVSHLDQPTDSFPNGPATAEDIVQYTPSLNSDHVNVDIDEQHV